MSRDISQPFTEADLKKLTEVFQSLPTYKAGGWILARDLPALVEGIGLVRTPDQVKAMQSFWEKERGGIVTLHHALEHAAQAHDRLSYLREYAVLSDLDGNGFITSDEFVKLMKYMCIHDPKFTAVSFDDFVTKADTNKDGQVSIDECVAWLATQVEP